MDSPSTTISEALISKFCFPPKLLTTLPLTIIAEGNSNFDIVWKLSSFDSTTIWILLKVVPSLSSIKPILLLKRLFNTITKWNYIGSELIRIETETHFKR